MSQATANPEGYISTLPGSSVVFHWPRSDYDQLLCVRIMDNVNCTWSGGFKVNKPKSFHINMRWVHHPPPPTTPCSVLSYWPPEPAFRLIFCLLLFSTP